METLSKQAKPYFSLMKPGILFGNAITALGGFALASKGHIDCSLLLILLAGLSLVIASGCTCNNYIDRYADQKMRRTQNRPLAKGIIPNKNAILFAIFLGISGALLLAFFVNLITAVVALIGFTVYVFFYSFSKYHSSHGTLIGSIAGAVPPVAGYCAVSNRLDMGALLLFIMIALWQMPHFFAIAIYRLDEYAAASIPVLPVKKGIPRTKINMLFYVAAFITASFMLTILGYTGLLYAIATTILGFAWLWLAIKGFKSDNDRVWARKMFIFSLLVVTGLCSIIPFSIA